MNKLVLTFVGETLLARKTKIYHDDLNHLAGTWTDKDAKKFEANVDDFEKIDLDVWK